MTDFQVGDRVSVEGRIISTVGSDGFAFVTSDTGETYRIWCEDLREVPAAEDLEAER